MINANSAIRLLAHCRQVKADDVAAVARSYDQTKEVRLAILKALVLAPNKLPKLERRLSEWKDPRPATGMRVQPSGAIALAAYLRSRGTYPTLHEIGQELREYEWNRAPRKTKQTC